MGRPGEADDERQVDRRLTRWWSVDAEAALPESRRPSSPNLPWPPIPMLPWPRTPCRSRVYLDEAPGLLPPWYMPSPMVRGGKSWRLPVVLVIVAAFVIIEAFGLCSTFGQLVPA